MSGLHGHRKRRLQSTANQNPGVGTAIGDDKDHSGLASPAEKIKWSKKRRKLHRNKTWWGRRKADKPEMATVSYIDIDMTNPRFGPKPSPGFTRLEESIGLSYQKWSSLMNVNRKLVIGNVDDDHNDDDDDDGDDGGEVYDGRFSNNGDDDDDDDDGMIVPMTEVGNTEESVKIWNHRSADSGHDVDIDPYAGRTELQVSQADTSATKYECVEQRCTHFENDITASDNHVLLNSVIDSTDDSQRDCQLLVIPSTLQANQNETIQMSRPSKTSPAATENSSQPRGIFSLCEIDLDDEILFSANASSNIATSLSSLNLNHLVDSGHKCKKMVSSASCSHLSEHHGESRSNHGLGRLKKSHHKSRERVSSVQDLTNFTQLDLPTITINDVKCPRTMQKASMAYCPVHDPAHTVNNNNINLQSAHIPLLDWELEETSSFVDVLLELSTDIQWDCTCPTADRHSPEPRKKLFTKSAGLRRVASDVYTFKIDPDLSLDPSHGWNTSDPDHNLSNDGSVRTNRKLPPTRTSSVSGPVFVIGISMN